MRILALTHGDNVGPGVFQDAVRAAGHELVERNVARDGVPDEAGDAAIVLGGAMHPDQEDRHPWLAPELRFLERELERGTPSSIVCIPSTFEKAEADPVNASAASATRRARSTQGR